MSSLAAAIPFGVASAVVYGTSIVVQHRTAQQHAGDTGQASAAGLLALARNPVWWMAIGGDVLGFLLQIIALSLGPVVVIQPLVVLMLPVSLVVSWAMGGHRPTRGDLLGVLGVLGGLGVFLALIGVPSPGRVPRPRVIGLAIGIVITAGAFVAGWATGRAQVLRGALYGAVAGMYFGALAVMVDAASDRISEAGFGGALSSARGTVPLTGVLILGAGGIVLTQMSFQVGTLKATLPANLATDPLTGVVLGIVLLHERIPFSAAHLIAYLLCFAAVVGGAVRLADAEAESFEEPAHMPIDPPGADP
jgi:drug/metabolite transporter (DMT)-like permease